MSRYDVVFILPEFSINYYLADIVIAIPAALLIGLTILITKRFKNPWFNRKLIHLSTVPAILMYLYVFKEPYAFFTYSVLIAFLLILHHIRKDEMPWFQIKGNLGEVYFTACFSILSLTMWYMKELAVAIMLFMAIGDAVTGLVRMRVCKERCKHWLGSLAMLLTTSIIGYILIGIIGLPMAIAATLAERQHLIDDNIGIPLAAIITYLTIALTVTL